MPRPTDFHKNIFYNYVGPKTSGSLRDRPLENNVTKALINTLELGGEAVFRPFFSKLDINEVSGVEFLLQRKELLGESARRRKGKKILLGISKQLSKQDCSGEDTSSSECGSLPDAWIYGDGFTVLVESKVHEGAFTKEQMQAHRERLGTPVKFISTTWGKIHELFAKLLPSLRKKKHIKEEFLVKQFIDFLEFSGMSEFTGFRDEHFSCFMLWDDEVSMRWVKEQLKYFAELVQKELVTSESFYEEVHVGKIDKQEHQCWVAFGPKGNDFGQETHQTISLSAEGLKVFVNVELQQATDRLKKVLKNSGGRFRDILRKAQEPYVIVLEKRIPIPKHPRKFDFVPKMRLHSSSLSEVTGDVAWSAFCNMTNLIHLPYLRIERMVSPKELLSKQGTDNSVKYVADILRRNHEIVQLLNDRSILGK